MFDKYFDLFYDFTKKRKWPIFFILLLLIATALAGLPLLKFSSDIEALLPGDPEISRSMNFLKNSGISNKVIISLGLTSPEKDKEALLQAADQLAGSLNPPLFTKVTVGLSESGMTGDMDFFFRNIPQIFSERDLASIDAQITSEKVSAKMRKNYLQLLKPEGIFMNSMLRSDPLGLNLLMLNKLKALSGSFGYNISMEKGHFISADGRHAMLIVQTTVPVTDTRGAGELFQNLEEQLRKLPDYISSDVVSGHAHSISNERVMKKDVNLTTVIASVVFVLLFLFVFRDGGATLIFLIPLFSIFQAVYLCYFFFGRLSYAVVGLSTVLAGISVDYGIQVYIAARNAKDAPGDIKRIAKPVFIGALTTGVVFFSFLFSGIEGYRQLGWLCIFGLAFSLVYCIFILPHFTAKRNTDVLFGERLENYNWSNKHIVMPWAMLTAVLMFFAFNVRFDGNIYKIDGTESGILQAEKRFQEVWGRNKTAMLVVPGESYEKALEENDAIYKEATTVIGAEKFAGFSMLWPAEKTRKENAARWKRFWEQGREEKLKKLIEEEGVKYGFSRQAFAPFFDNLYKTPEDSDTAGPGFISGLKDRFLRKNRDGYQSVSFFPDEKESVEVVKRIITRHPGAFLVSESALSEKISGVVYADIAKMAVITAVLVVLFTFLYLRNFREVVISFVPVVTGLVWLFGIMSLSGVSFNLSTLITGITLMSICVDYGIFMVYRCRHNLKTGIVMGVALSALTTIIGTGVLIFAKHPALFYVGLTMTIGVGSGYLSSLLVVPYLYRITMPSEKGKERT